MMNNVSRETMLKYFNDDVRKLMFDEENIEEILQAIRKLSLEEMLQLYELMRGLDRIYEEV